MVRAKISSNDLERQGGKVQCQVGEKVARKKKDKRKIEREKERRKERQKEKNSSPKAVSGQWCPCPA